MFLAGKDHTPIVLALDTSILLPGLLLAGALLVGAVVIAVASSWRKRAGTPASQTSDQLAHYRRLYEQGVISQEEYSRLRSLLGGQLRSALDVPGGLTTPPPAAPETGGPAGPPARGSPPA